MSMENVREIIEKAERDTAFYRLLSSNSEAALKGYDLTSEEKEMFKVLGRDILAISPNELEMRVSKGMTGHIRGSKL